MQPTPGEIMQFCSLAVAVILALNTFFNGRTHSGEEKAEQKAETRFIREQLSQLNAKMDTITKKIDSHAERLVSVEHRIKALEGRVDTLEGK